ncbi:MSEP-CTERM sorting domain-containing protein [Geosporobacter ferrireducens]|uniref:MSEP-CTERM sorting domain-containing protein n=1 Tax=Geosporobacter ferrireducens TaxID=1424294 RepID=UPI00139BC7FF|nr:MSEP-CTERM sorting domain-containing protein [Geosporobacter ferrireducens]MTI57079.1 MSEP-CTERM sorting domain-containing protein [Geosporobacter ferrireducens]
MKKLYNPFFILFTVTLPQLLMMGIFARIFWFLHTEFTERQVFHWTVFGSLLGIVCLGFTLYGILRWKQKKELQTYVAYGIFVFYFCFLIAYFFIYTEMIPAAIPSYMLMGITPGITTLTLTMPALAHGALLIIENTVEHYQMQSILKPFFFMIAMPLFWYLLMNLLSMGSLSGMHAFEYMFPVVFVISSAAFLLLFVTILYIALKRKSNLWNQYIGALVFLGSLMGLTLNQSLGNLFGDFSHFGFYLCNMAATGVLMIPPVTKAKTRLFIFMAKGCLLWYSLYFFMVFLPYIPLSLMGIIVFGLGILLLVPIVLLFLHMQSLWTDYGYLQQFYNKRRLIAIFVLQLLVIPTIIGITVRQDQKNLNQALQYTYQRGYQEEKMPSVNRPGIRRALQTIKHTNGMDSGRNNFFTGRTSTPYLTSLYHYYVLDNLSISSDKVRRLEEIFFGEYSGGKVLGRTEANTSTDVRINEIKSETLYDPEQQVYRSWVNFELENTLDQLSEFYSIFTIPEGAYISNYYLYVEGEKKYGMIADKRAANWIYEQNKIRNRDPGVLTYLSGNEIEFKIFPFLGNEVRKTGFEILHRAPIELRLGSERLSLQSAASATYAGKPGDRTLHPQIQYLTKEMKAELPRMIRKPKYYFLLDYSKGNEKNTDEYIQRVKHFIEEQGIHEAIGEIIGVNFEENRVKYQQGWEDQLQGTEIKGGFYADFPVKRILYEHYSWHLEEEPIFVMVTNAIEKTILSKDFSEFRFTNPEGLKYYHLENTERLMEHSLEIQPAYDQGKVALEIPQNPVLLWTGEDGRNIYLPDDGQDSIILLEDRYDVTPDEFKGPGWENGVMLQALYRSYLLHPEQYFEKSLSLVKGSITSHVMSPLTSFIVLENQAQEKVMLEKQKQILETKKPLDIGDRIEMNEPPLLIMICLGIGFLMIRKLWRKRKISGELF